LNMIMRKLSGDFHFSILLSRHLRVLALPPDSFPSHSIEVY
jgi:hypothetical protein